MKKIIVLFLTLGIFLEGYSQAKLSITSVNGEPFYLFLNGVRINNRPIANVSVNKIPVGIHKISIKIPGKIGNVTREIDLSENNTLYDYLLVNDRGNYYLSFYAAYSQAFIDDHTDFSIKPQIPQQPEPDNKDINISINVNQVNTQTTVANNGNGSSTNVPPPPPPQPVISGKCLNPVSIDEFNAFLASLESKSFDDTKMTMAKQYIRNNCVTSSQVYLILKQIDFEDSKLKLAKYAYQYVFDPEKYYKVNNAFEYSSSVEELNKYIESMENN
jgi:hypothetical protein